MNVHHEKKIMTSSIKRIIRGLVPLLVFAALPLYSILSHGEKHEEKDNDTLAINAAPGESADTTQDSVYIIINENYLKVRYIFEKSCFDCHSKYAKYPWYYKTPGIKVMIDEDIKEARGHFDLSNDFPFISEHSQLDLLNDIKEEIENNDMPLLSYRMMHWGRLVEGAKRDSVFAWINASIALLKQAEEAGK